MITHHRHTTTTDHGPRLLVRDLTICGVQYHLEIRNRDGRLSLGFHEVARFREGHGDGVMATGETDSPEFEIRIWEGLPETVLAAKAAAPHDDVSRGVVTFERVAYRPNHDHSDWQTCYVFARAVSGVDEAKPDSAKSDSGSPVELHWSDDRPDPKYDRYREFALAFGSQTVGW